MLPFISFHILYFHKELKMRYYLFLSQNLKEKVYKINEEVANLYHKTLYENIAKPAQEYVKKRKLDNKTLINLALLLYPYETFFLII